jgi:hypothetical protein
LAFSAKRGVWVGPARVFYHSSRASSFFPLSSRNGAMRARLRPATPSRNQIPVLAFRNGQDQSDINTAAEQHKMKKIFAIVAIAILAAGATTATAIARTHHRHHHYWSLGFRGSNAELRGNNGNSASGSNSLANPKNAAGVP